MGGVGLIIPAGLMVPGLHERSDHRELLVVQTERSTPNARPSSTAVYVPKPLERIVIPARCRSSTTNGSLLIWRILCVSSSGGDRRKSRFLFIMAWRPVRPSFASFSSLNFEKKKKEKRKVLLADAQSRWSSVCG